MKIVKSERLRKLESELKDLEQWLQLGLVPKKDLERHKEEIALLQDRIREEKERIVFLKEGGTETDESVFQKKNTGKSGYEAPPTESDINLSDSQIELTDAGFEMETYITEDSSALTESEADLLETEHGDVFAAGEDDLNDEEEDESYFSDKNRWRRGGIMDPDADEW